MTNAYIELVRSGAATAFVWGPQGNQTGDSFPLGLFTDTRVEGGGQATLHYATQQFLRDHVAPGTRLYDPAVDNPAVNVLQTATGRMLVNTTAFSQAVTVDGTSYVLDGFEVVIQTRPPTVHPRPYFRDATN